MQEGYFKDSDLSLGRLAENLNTSTHILSQVINESEKRSFYELLAIYRVEAAKRLLSDNAELTIAAIAYEVGYNSLSAFNNAFKKVTGITPSAFRSEGFHD